MVKVISANSEFYAASLGPESGDGMSYDKDGLTDEEREIRDRYEAYRRECVARRLGSLKKFTRPTTIGKRIS